MIKLRIGDKVKVGDSIATVITLRDNDAQIIFEDKSKLWYGVDSLRLTKISLDRWKGMSDIEMIEYLHFNPELTRQWTVNWIGTDVNHELRMGQDSLGAVDTLITYENPSNGILAQNFQLMVLLNHPELDQASILGFWEE